MANNEIEAFFEAEAFFKVYNYLYPGNRIFYKTQTGKIREALVFNRTSSETLVNEDSNPKGLVYDALDVTGCGETVVVDTVNFVKEDKCPKDELFFFTFGSDEKFPYQGGYLIVRAKDRKEAFDLFREKHPDRSANCLNCAFCYTAYDWAKLLQGGMRMGQCHEVIEKTECCKDGDYSPIIIFVPAKNELLCISEGTGDNLLPEDEEDGIVDYVYYETYDLDYGTVEEGDGGQMDMKEYVRDKYPSLEACIPNLLDFVYNDRNLSYIMLESEKEEQ